MNLKSYFSALGAASLILAAAHILSPPCIAQSPSIPGEVSAAAERRQAYEQFAMQHQGDPTRGERVFADAQKAACIRCHTTDGSRARVGPDLSAIADKFPRPELIRSILEPSSPIAIGYETTILATGDEEFQGVIKQATDSWIELMGWDGKTFRIATADIKVRRSSETSFMPASMETVMTQTEFADLISYLEALRLPTNALSGIRGMPEFIPQAKRSVSLQALFGRSVQCNRPLWFGEMPGHTNRYVVLEHAGKSWVIERTPGGEKQTLLVDSSDVVRVGGATGLLGFAFHPKFLENRKYYLKYQVVESGRISTLLVERRFAEDLVHDSGEPSRLLLKIEAITQDHTGGCIVFGPDGFLYLGMGDTGPQGDPQGHGQDLSILPGKMLRIDVDRTEDGRAYAIPLDNPFRDRAGARPEIWAYGLREPWRYSFDSLTGELWVGDVGQDRFEEITILRAGENHGWNVFEGFTPFSERYRRVEARYIPPVFSYSHRDGVSVTGGFVYRGRQAPAMWGHYICGDFESRRLWALRQTNRELTGILEIGRAPSRVVSFAQDHAGELYLVGYDDGVIYRIDLATVDSTPLARRVLAETSERGPVGWRYSLQAPAPDWSKTAFDDSAWLLAPGGFGSSNTPGTVVRTEWTTQNIWLRRDFTLATNALLAQAHSVALRLHHDEDVEIYLNGVEAMRLPRWTSGYIEVALSDEAVRALHPGRNLMAIHCRQNSGGQYIDAGLVEYLESKQ